MPTPEIQISKDGLKLSYQRYMADSAAGFVVILGAALAISKGVPLPLFGHSLEGIIKLSSQAQLFVFLISFLLTTPMGLLINGLSWFMLGWLRRPLVIFWFTLPDKWYNPFLPTKTALHAERITKFFQLEDTKSNVHDLSELYGDYLKLFFHEKLMMEHVTGLIKFTRNLACISLLPILWCPHMTFWLTEAVQNIPRLPDILSTFLFSTITCSFLYSLMEGFSCLKTLSTVYLLCSARGISNDNPAVPEELIRKIHVAYFGDNEGKQMEN